VRRYRLDRDALADLYEIHEYVARDNPPAADRLIDRLKDQFRLLARQPLMGQARPELAPDLRSFGVGNYVIFYRPAQDGIEVARVIHGARDVDSLF
jgi:toxin ParE1/3/4